MSTPSRIAALRQRDGDNCALCGKPIDFTLPRDGTRRVPGRSMGASVDHIVPRAAGGSENLSNCQLAHGVCNQRKGGKHNGVDYAVENLWVSARAQRGVWHRRRNEIMAESDFESWSAARGY